MKTGMYGLPLEVLFCKSCTLNNQRPSSTVEFRNKPDAVKRTVGFNEEGICEACIFSEKKKDIDWEKRALELKALCDKYRRHDGRFDVIVPGSGGKDSVKAAHVLKYQYQMHPLLVTWPPQLYTKRGFQNFQAWLQGGFSNYTYWPNQKLHALLTKLAFKNLVHPFQPFIIGQKNLAPKLSVLLDIPLVIFGENEAEYGNPVQDNLSPTRDEKYYSASMQLEEIFLGGVCAKQIMQDYGYDLTDMHAYLPETPEKIQKVGTKVHYLGYYLPWHPQETYYFAAEQTGFLPNDFRTEGGYSRYSSIDDKIDWLHYYTTYIKFGIGRATNDSAQEIRNRDITREEGIALVKRFDGEFPYRYIDDCLKYMQISRDEFDEVIEKARPDHLWKKENGEWVLRHPIWKSGIQ